jgi:FkbM family methyltransferase
MSKKCYIEAGALDGVDGSRSIHLSNNPDWVGILVEPTPHKYAACVKNRSNVNTIMYDCALVPRTYNKPTVRMMTGTLSDSMNTSSISLLENLPTHNFNNDNGFEVQARTLQSILDENKISVVDYLFLDVEGAEADVINGIDYEKTIIHNLEIECHYWRTITLEEETKIHVENMKKFDMQLQRIIDYKLYFIRNTSSLNYKQVYDNSIMPEGRDEYNSNPGHISHKNEIDFLLKW